MFEGGRIEGFQKTFLKLVGNQTFPTFETFGNFSHFEEYFLCL